MKQLIMKVHLPGREMGKGVRTAATQTESFKRARPFLKLSALPSGSARHAKADRAALRGPGCPRLQGVEAFWPHCPSLLWPRFSDPKSDPISVTLTLALYLL